jgi:hypothetical protein
MKTGVICYDSFMKLLSINLPQYTVEHEPDIDGISKAIDDLIKREFMGEKVVVRGVASSAHPDKTVTDLIGIIRETGTDRYDPHRVGDRYENIDNKHIDLFGVPADVSNDSEIAQVIVWGFYHSAKAVHGQPIRIDILTVYDADQLEQVHHQYEGRDDIKDDGFTFKYPENRTKALLGIIRIV